MDIFINRGLLAKQDLRQVYDVRYRTLAALTLIVFASCTFIPVQAQSNHTLEWGIEVGEEFTYALQRAYFSDPIQRTAMEIELPWLQYIEAGDKVKMSVTQLDPVPEMINSSFDMPVSHCSLERENDSTLIGTQLTRFAVPIGDWEFLTEIGNITQTEGLTLVDTAEEWGTVGRGAYQQPGGSVVSAYIELRYEKDNGTLNYLRYRYRTLGSDLIDVIFVHWYPGMPTIIGGGIQTTTILLIAIGGVVALIVTIVSYRYFKGKKSIAQKLGE
ncbi:hypothetical protein EU524_01870 [Candidatus Thorarchaeota archaeon]|nr:MAG: hypothetical protein EU524_01870 [Candidatus Thorarchaeota archaeon]